jgi:hypothetical protein
MYLAFKKYTEANSLPERFESYKALVSLVLPPGYVLWSESEIAPKSKDPSSTDKDRLTVFWKGLTS